MNLSGEAKLLVVRGLVAILLVKHVKGIVLAALSLVSEVLCVSILGVVLSRRNNL